MSDTFMLMHRNIGVAVISIDDRGHITKISEKVKTEYLPLGAHKDISDLKKWWDNRATPISRKGFKAFLESENISSAQMYLTKNLGLSMIDCYWIKPVDSDLKWERVNFFTNDFSVLEHVDSNEINKKDKIYSFRPDSSLQGELQKEWFIRDGKRYLVKGSHGNSCQQSLNEIVASLLHKKQGMKNHVEYKACKLPPDLSNTENMLGCYCEAFTNEDIEFIPAYEVCSSRKKENSVSEYENFIMLCAEHGLDEFEARSHMEYMILSDFMITNTDRHMNNFGVLRDSHSLRFVGMAPIFDSGNSMFWSNATWEIPAVKEEFKNIEVTSLRGKENDMLKYVVDRNIVSVGRAPLRAELENIYAMDINASVMEEKYKKILDAYEMKLSLLDEFQRMGRIQYGRKTIAISKKQEKEKGSFSVNKLTEKNMKAQMKQSYAKNEIESGER